VPMTISNRPVGVSCPAQKPGSGNFGPKRARGGKAVPGWGPLQGERHYSVRPGCHCRRAQHRCHCAEGPQGLSCSRMRRSLPRITLTAAFVIVRGEVQQRDEGETVQPKGKDCAEGQPKQAARVLVHQQATSRHYLPQEPGPQGLCSGGRAGGLSRPARARQHADVDQAGGDSAQGRHGDHGAGRRVQVAGGGTDRDSRQPTGSQNEEDVATIAGVTPMGSGKYMLSLTQGLSFNHTGDPLGTPDGFGGYINRRRRWLFWAEHCDHGDGRAGAARAGGGTLHCVLHSDAAEHRRGAVPAHGAAGAAGKVRGMPLVSPGQMTPKQTAQDTGLLVGSQG